MNIDTLLLDQIRKLTTAHGLENSIDETELDCFFCESGLMQLGGGVVSKFA
jgi:hypothetical protein